MAKTVLDLVLQTIGRKLASRIQAAPAQSEISGLTPATAPFLLSALAQETGRTILFVTARSAGAAAAGQSLPFWQKIIGQRATAANFPAREVLPYEQDKPGIEEVGGRLQVLDGLEQGQKLVLAADIKAVLLPTLPRQLLTQSRLDLKVGRQVAQAGSSLSFQQVREALFALGFQPSALVEAVGEFSVRGGLIDVFPVGRAEPLRLEFDGQKLASLRSFDIRSQRTLANIKEAELDPASEIVLDARQRKQVLIKALNENILHNFFFSVYDRPGTILDYLPADALIVWDEPELIARQAEDLLAEAERILQEKKDQAPWPDKFYFTLPEIKAQTARFSGLALPQFGRPEALNLGAKGLLSFDGRLDQFKDDLARKLKTEQMILIATSQASRLKEILDEDIFRAGQADGRLLIEEGSLPEGFALPEQRLEVLTDAEIFGRTLFQPTRAKSASPGADPKLLADLKTDDAVVHANHGIGFFKGLQKLKVRGLDNEFILLEYADADKLYVPLDQMGLLQKYTGTLKPKVNHLGTPLWAKTKKKVKKATEDIAKEIIRIHLIRQSRPGYAFAADSAWQADLETAFPFEETPHQAKAIADVKKDMESSRPMDRLVLGDAGYGKTEVALRAAFKAINSGKQVAVLVPTTILAEQHWHTFSQRFAPFPFVIEMLSRFQRPSQQAKIVQSLSSGGVDVVIGTHRLLQNDIHFKDLGLLIVDEEQRFGVAAKEKLKKWRENVDVLSLSATPIPRTLYSALQGVKDLSLISTPPEDRLPIKTFIYPYQDQLVREAIQRELERSGQVFYVFNFIRGLARIRDRIQKMFPQARVGIAHGRMNEDELEKVMDDFSRSRIDILATTNIVENGLDIPNANTLIIEAAERFGLADLYQLRGRVGRSYHQAYAYLFYRPADILTEEARARLQAIQDFTTLGSGFKIAMKDLEIRGAGDLLGAEQHGHIVAIGFDLYSQFLSDSVKEASGQTVAERPATEVDLKVSAFFPNTYIPDAAQRIALYKRLMNVDSLEEIQNLEEEISDRFGRFPRPVQTLLAVVRIRFLASCLGIQKIQAKEEGLWFYWPAGQPATYKIGDRPSPAPQPALAVIKLFPKKAQWHHDHLFLRLPQPLSLSDLHDLGETLGRSGQPSAIFSGSRR